MDDHAGMCLRYRNAVQREAKWLRQQYYKNDHKIKQLRTTDARKWWHAVKRFIGTSQSNKCLTNLLDYNRDNVLADDINNFFQELHLTLNP